MANRAAGINRLFHRRPSSIRAGANTGRGDRDMVRPANALAGTPGPPAGGAGRYEKLIQINDHVLPLPAISIA